MATALKEAIVSLAKDASGSGIAMGAIVDTLEREGFRAQDIETTLWEMMNARQLTPCGFVCRVVRRRGRDGRMRRIRTYEFMLMAWSEGRDRQLDLELGG